MSFPPHLPPPTCSIPRHRQWQRIKILLVATFFGLCAGISGAAVLIGWVWPGPGESGNWAFTSNSSITSRGQSIDKVRSRMGDTLFTLYAKATTLSGNVSLASGDRVADGVLVVSSGWLLAYVPNFDGWYKDWVIANQSGALYRAQKVFFDKRSGLVYVKIAALHPKAPAGQEQFKVAAFADVPQKFDDALAWQDGAWYPTYLLGSAPGAVSDSHLDTAPAEAFVLNSIFKSGTLVVNSDGAVIGFVKNGGLILPVAFTTHFLSSIEGRTAVVYPSLGVEGWFSSEKLLILHDQLSVGFTVNRSVGNRALWRRGDIILEINGRPMTSANVWYTIGEKSVRAKVLRGGKEIDLSVPVIEL